MNSYERLTASEEKRKESEFRVNERRLRNSCSNEGVGHPAQKSEVGGRGASGLYVGNDMDAVDWAMETVDDHWRWAPLLFTYFIKVLLFIVIML